MRKCVCIDTGKRMPGPEGIEVAALVDMFNATGSPAWEFRYGHGG